MTSLHVQVLEWQVLEWQVLECRTRPPGLRVLREFRSIAELRRRSYCLRKGKTLEDGTAERENGKSSGQHHRSDSTPAPPAAAARVLAIES